MKMTRGSWLFKPLSRAPVAPLAAQTVKNPPAMRETRARSLGWENPLEKGMATQSSILAWEIPWTVARGATLSIGSQGPTRLSVHIYFRTPSRTSLVV